MALPHLAPYNVRKNIYEAVIVKNRDYESSFREKWNNNANYFNSNNVIATQQQQWGSNRSFNKSMDKWHSYLDKEAKHENLKFRREKLANLLKKERDTYQIELNTISDKSNPIEEMKIRTEVLKSSREERRKQTAEELMMEHWRENTPELRMVESARHQKHVIQCWSGQIVEREEILEKEQKAKEEYDKFLARENLLALENEKEIEKKRIEDEINLKNILWSQAQQMKEEEKKAQYLKQQEELLHLQQIYFQKMNEEQKKTERFRENLEHGKILLRQHAAALRRKSKEVQKELEEDRLFLENMIQLEKEDQGIQTSRQDQAKADALWMKQIVEEQMEFEKQREAEIDMLFQEEAKKVWEKRKLEWDKEKKARQRLMNEVLVERKSQLDAKMHAVKLEQQKSIDRREEILNDIEIAHRLSLAEKEKQEKQKFQRKIELEEAMTARKEGQFVEKLELDRLIEHEKREENNYENLLRLETERLNMNPYQQRQYPKKQAWN